MKKTKDLYKINPLKIGGLYKLKNNQYPYWVLDCESDSRGPWLRTSFLNALYFSNTIKSINDNNICLLFDIKPNFLHLICNGHKSIFYRKYEYDHKDYTLEFLFNWILIDFRNIS